MSTLKHEHRHAAITGRRFWTNAFVVSLSLTLIVLTGACTTVTRTALTAAGPGSGGSGTNGVAAGSQSGPDASGGPSANGSAASNAPASSATSAGSTKTGTAAGTGATGGSSGGSTAGGGSAGAASGCSQVVKIGTTYSSDEGQVLTALGNASAGASATSSNYVQQAQALYQHMADYINGHGGLAGCKMQWVYYDFKFADPNGESDNSQNECSSFAEDAHAFAVMNEENENSTLITCLAQHHVVSLFSSAGFQYRPTPQDFTQYRGYLYQPDFINPYRFKPMIDLLNQGGYFGPDPSKAKVGILEADDGTGSNQYLVDTLWKPALAAMGITPTVFTFFQCTTVANCGTTTNQFQSAVLQFRSAGVDHVLYTPDGGDAAFFFTQVAHSQGYTPRYGMTSDSVPALWSTEPADQRPNAMAASYQMVDLAPNYDNNQASPNPPNPTRSTCDSIFKKDYPSVYQGLYGICDNMLFLQAALNGAPSVTAQNLLAGAEKLGNSFPLASGYSNATFAPPNHYDGATSARVTLWDEAHQTWNYVTPAVAIP